MAYFYVKSGGTATGDGGRYASQKTGTWATAFSATSEYYDTIDDAYSATTAPANGDLVLVSHLHNGTTVVTAHLTYGVASGVILWVSVDDTDITIFKDGARETWTGTGWNIFINNFTFALGFSFTFESPLTVGSGNYASVFGACNYKATNVNADLTCAGSLILESTIEHNLGVTMDVMQNGTAGPTRVYGLTVPASSNNSDAFMRSDSWFSLMGLDLSNEPATIDIVTLLGAARPGLQLNGAYLPASWSGNFLNGTPVYLTHDSLHIELYNYGSGPDDWSYYWEEVTGQIEATNAIYYDTSPTGPDGSTKLSYKVDTTNGCKLSSPIRWRLPAFRFNPNSASENTVTLKVAYTGTGLTDRDIALLVAYPDVTNPNLLKFEISWPTISGSTTILDPFATPTNLTDTGVELTEWTGLTSGDDTYDLSVTIPSASAHANPATPPILYLLITKDFGAESLYVSNKLVLS